MLAFSWLLGKQAKSELQVRDMQGGNQTVAQLYVASPVTRGLWAYADSSELFNSAPLTGVPVYALVQAFL